MCWNVGKMNLKTKLIILKTKIVTFILKRATVQVVGSLRRAAFGAGSSVSSTADYSNCLQSSI